MVVGESGRARARDPWVRGSRSLRTTWSQSAPEAQPATHLEPSVRLRQSPAPGILIAAYSLSRWVIPHRRSRRSRPPFPHSHKEG